MDTVAHHKKIALVTGGGRRIGKAIVDRLIKEDIFVIAHYNRSVITDCKDNCISIQGDLSNKHGIFNFIERLKNITEKIDVLVNNASLYTKTPIDNWDEHIVDSMMNVNLRAPLELSRTAMNFMKKSKWGRIINICDLLTYQPPENYLAYVTTRASMFGLTRSLSIEGAKYGVTANCLVLGTVLLGEHDIGIEQAIIKNIPVRYIPGTGPVEDAVLWLINADNYITGAFINIDGGRSLK